MLLRRLEFLGVGFGGRNNMNINERLNVIKEHADNLKINIDNLMLTAICMNDINNLNNYAETVRRLNAELLNEVEMIDQIVNFMLENVQLIKCSRS